MEKWINSSGNITVPVAIRRELGLAHEKVDIMPLENGDIILKRIEGKCVFCGGYKHVEQYMKKYVCCDCRSNLAKK